MGSSDPQKEFDDIFTRRVQMTGDCFFLATEEEVRAEYSAMAQSRKYDLRPGFRFDDIDVLTKVCAPGTVDRFVEWESEKQNLESLSGVYIADLDHHPGNGPTAGPHFPSLITHSTMYSWSQGRLATGLEGFAAHGVHMFEKACPGPACRFPFTNVIRRMSRRHQGILAGNSLHCPSILAWYVYCLGNLQSRAEPTRMPMRFPVPEDEQDD